eukprot:evm.model.scf_1078.1 EVM.evm.TU.scf_1078.1   scf_1078:22511-29277(-)
MPALNGTRTPFPQHQPAVFTPRRPLFRWSPLPTCGIPNPLRSPRSWLPTATHSGDDRWDGNRNCVRGRLRAVHAAPISDLAAGVVGGGPIVEAWRVWAALAFASALGLWSEKTKLGRELSGALVATILGLVLSNTGIIPCSAPQYNVVNKFLLPLAIPLLLFSANLRRVVQETGPLLIAFIIGTLATVAGTLVGFALFPLRSMGPDGWRVAAALCARHIGGAVNYVGVSEALATGPSAMTAGLAADNVLCVLYFTVLYGLARKIGPEEEEGRAEEGVVDGAGGIKVLEACTGLALSTCICFVGAWLAAAFNAPELSIVVITALTVTLATAVPQLLKGLTASSEGIAAILLQVFFASVGASGSLGSVLSQAPLLFCFSFTQIAVHLALVLAIGRMLGLGRKALLLASNANVGGPTTAAGMASTKGWRASLVPALLVGILGYAIATFISIGLGYGALQHM